MKKRIVTDLLPVCGAEVFTVISRRPALSRPRLWSRLLFSLGGPALLILGAMLLTALVWPASASAQTTSPPPEADSDELILMDFFQETAEGSSPNQPPLPSLPPNVTPAAPTASAPPAAPTSPAASGPPADSGPPAGPPLVNLPPLKAPPAEPSPGPPQEPSTARPTAPSPAPTESARPVPEQAPVEAVPSTQVPAGYTPLPTVPLQPTAAPAPVPDPFTLTPTSEPAELPAESAAPADSRTVPLGGAQGLPAPQWEKTDLETNPSQSQIISGSPLPQFDASQSRWIQLEIGQGDGSGPAPSAAPRPTSVYSLPDPAAKTQARPPDPVEAAVEAATDQALDQAISQPPAAAERSFDTPAGRQKLRDVFSDLNPSDSEVLRAPITAKPPAGGSSSPAAGTAPPQVGSLPQAAGPAPDRTPAPGPAAEDVGSSSILKAGGLLTVEEQFGAAEILPPLSGRPRWPVTEAPAPAQPAAEPPAVSTKPEAPAAAPVVKAAPARDALRPTAKPAAKPAPSKKAGAGQAKKGASKKNGRGAQAAPAAPVGLGLIIINETGRERVGQQYRSVLAQMGYKVVSVGEGRPGRGPAGQTVINYRPGLKAKAQAVARHLPGKKVLVEAKKGQVLATEVMIYIR